MPFRLQTLLLIEHLESFHFSSNINSNIPVPRVELELPRKWWLNKTKIEDPDHDPYKLTHGRYNLKDLSWWDNYEPGDLDRAGETLAPPSAPTGEGPTRRRGRPPLDPAHRKPKYMSTGRPRGRPPLDPAHRKPKYAPTGRPRGRPPLDPAHRKPKYVSTGRPRGRPPLDPAHRKPKYAPTGRPRGRPPLTRRK
ncbi:hypothetical protein V8F06_011814 [Rhypophila decipiens]